MNIFMKISLLSVLLVFVAFADNTGSKTKQTFELLNKHGGHTAYVLNKNEFAVTKKGEISSDIELVREVKEYPAYKLFSIQRKPISSSSTESRINQAGSVYYKNGMEDDAHRYIGTGQVIVVFNSVQPLDLKAFAQKYQLVYLKTVSSGREQTVLFANHSPKNDIELSSSLVTLETVKSAKPNWILPLKLF